MLTTTTLDRRARSRYGRRQHDDIRAYLSRPDSGPRYSFDPNLDDADRFAPERFRGPPVGHRSALDWFGPVPACAARSDGVRRRARSAGDWWRPRVVEAGKVRTVVG